MEGRLRSRNWETKEGQKRTSLEVDARSVQFLEKLQGQEESNSEPAAEEVAVNTTGAASPSGTVEEEIPF